VYDEIELINVIIASTGYTNVGYAEETSAIDIHDNLLAPRIQVGHEGIKLRNSEDTFSNMYSEIENQELLVTAIQFQCLRKDLAVVRTAIKQAYQGFTPYPNDSDYSSLSFLEAKVVMKTSDKIWWQEVVGLVMPRIS